jgi:hypothetical protein
VLCVTACQEGQPLQLLQQQPRAQYVQVERTRNRAVQYSQKIMGASRLVRAEPHGGSPGHENYFMVGTLDSTLGAYVGLREVARTWRLNTGRPMGSQK